MSVKQNIKKLLGAAQKQSKKYDGRRQVALALAASTKLSADAAEKFFDLPFSSAKIGLKDKSGMRGFKNHLAELMPSSSKSIRGIPEEPGLTPNDVAKYVATLLKAADAVHQPLRAAPSIIVKPASAEARSKCKDMFGKDFGEKASDRMVEALQSRMASGPRKLAAGMMQTMVLEFQATEIPEIAAPAVGAGRESFLASRGHMNERAGAYRDTFYKLISPVRAELERKIASAVSAFRESAQDLGSASDICWLNDSMRTMSTPTNMAGIAAEPRLSRIGLPRMLERELNVTGNTVRASQYRQTNNLTGKGILVAVIDGEVDANHPALAGRVLQKKNYTKEAWGHADHHGTGVAGIIGSAQQGLLGMAPAVMIASYKVFATNPADQGSEFDATLAIQQALEDGVRIANCSWGLGQATDGTSREARACNRAWDLGLVLIKSAGNKGPLAGTLTSPADARGVIVVGATDRQGTSLQSYSSRGPVASKPGPDVVVPGGSPLDGMVSLIPGSTTGAIGCGTSFAAPHVVGLAALLLEQSPNQTPDQIKTALIAKCSPLNPNPANGCGAGLILM